MLSLWHYGATWQKQLSALRQWRGGFLRVLRFPSSVMLVLSNLIWVWAAPISKAMIWKEAVHYRVNGESKCLQSDLKNLIWNLWFFETLRVNGEVNGCSLIWSRKPDLKCVSCVWVNEQSITFRVNKRELLERLAALEWISGSYFEWGKSKVSIEREKASCLIWSLSRANSESYDMKRALSKWVIR